MFGGFVEHLGRCIYGRLYEEGSPLSDDRGFRKDVLGLLRELRLGHRPGHHRLSRGRGDLVAENQLPQRQLL